MQEQRSPFLSVHRFNDSITIWEDCYKVQSQLALSELSLNYPLLFFIHLQELLTVVNKTKKKNKKKVAAAEGKEAAAATAATAAPAEVKA